MNSHYVLFELGARWGAKKPLYPLITDRKGAAILKGPLQGINALNAYEEGQLYQFITDVGKQLKITPESPNSYQDQIKHLIKTVSDASISTSS